MGDEHIDLDTDELCRVQRERLNITRDFLLYDSKSKSTRSKDPKDVTGWFLHEKALLRSLKSLHFSCEVHESNMPICTHLILKMSVCRKFSLIKFKL